MDQDVLMFLINMRMSCYGEDPNPRILLIDVGKDQFQRSEAFFVYQSRWLGWNRLALKNIVP